MIEKGKLLQELSSSASLETEEWTSECPLRLPTQGRREGERKREGGRKRKREVFPKSRNFPRM